MVEMENFKAAKRIKTLIQEEHANVPKLKAEFLERTKAQLDLESQALKANALKKRGWEKCKEKAEKNKQAIERLQYEISISKEKIESLEKELSSIGMSALYDVKLYYRPSFEEAVRKLAKKLKEAEGLELEVERIKNEASAKMQEISFIPYTVVPPIKRLLISYDDRKEYWPISCFLKDCKDAGIEVDELK